MKKDLNWFKEQLEDIEMNTPRLWSHDSIWMLDRVNDLINQLDEPEVLSQELIYEKAIDTHVDTANGEIQVTFILDDLQNLLVPKQELPVIPQFVADWIEASRHATYHLLGAVYDGAYSEDMKEWLFKGDKRTRQDNQDKLTRAWLDGFTIANEEEEQKYRVIFPSVDKCGKGFNYLAKDCYHKELWVEDARTDGLAWEERSSFTEDEIRDLDKGDILFEHFAVEVEELEE